MRYSQTIDGLELRNAWLKAKAEGVTQRSFAAMVGLSYSALRGRLYRAKDKSSISPDPEGEVRREIQDNYMSLEVGFSRRILTLEDLLEAGKVDQSEWKVERYIINKWEVGAKTAKRHLVWEDGQIIEGEIDDPGKLTVEPLIQVKAWLVRKAPIAITPIVKPIVLKVSSPPPRPIVAHGGWKSALILPDPQFGFSRNIDTGGVVPYHSRDALDICLQVAATDNFDALVFLGDNLDLPEWSDKFIRTPDFYFTTQAAVVEAAWWFSQFRQAEPAADFYILEGNHDKRMVDALAVHLKSAYNLRPATEIALPPSLSVPRLLGLDGLGITWVGDYPKSEVWLNDQLVCTHGEIVRAVPGATATTLVLGANHSIIFGHIHRIELATRTINGRGKTKSIFAASPGCLCRIDFVVPGHSKGRGSTGWQQGFAVAHYKESGEHFVNLYEIQDGCALYQGAEFRARDRLAEMRQDTKWEL